MEQDHMRRRARDDRRARRAYRPPRLVRYGSLRKLTRGSSGFKAETGGMKAMCL
jgi:hypothetical protein